MSRNIDGVIPNSRHYLVIIKKLRTQILNSMGKLTKVFFKFHIFFSFCNKTMNKFFILLIFIFNHILLLFNLIFNLILLFIKDLIINLNLITFLIHLVLILILILILI
jgi:hypothetical protein